MSKKTETVQEFLARGGQINKVPTPPQEHREVLQRKGNGVVTIMSMGEAELFYSESKAKPKVKQSKSSTIDIGALPPELRVKFVDRLIKGTEDEEDEEET